MLQLSQLAKVVVGKIGATLREWALLEEREYRAPNLLEHLLTLGLRGNNVELDVHIGLESQEICHSQNSGIHGGSVLDFKGANNGTATKP
jgi:hypothetical protein